MSLCPLCRGHAQDALTSELWLEVVHGAEGGSSSGYRFLV